MAKEDKFADEVMSDDELDGVAGGNCYETADDTRFLNSLNGSTDRYGAPRIYFLTGDATRESIQGAWAKVGISAKIKNHYIPSNGTSNEYYLNGQQITQEQARQHAMNVVGKQMTESDWKW